jgi:hypothetical protein
VIGLDNLVTGNPDNIAHLVEESIRDVFLAFSLASENLCVYDQYLLAGYRRQEERGRPNMVIKVAATTSAARTITRTINSFGFGSNITVDFSVSQEATLILEEIEGMAKEIARLRSATRRTAKTRCTGCNPRLAGIPGTRAPRSVDAALLPLPVYGQVPAFAGASAGCWMCASTTFATMPRINIRMTDDAPYGGGGGMHACALAKELGIKKVVIPAKNYKHSVDPRDYCIDVVAAETLEDYLKECFV